MVLHQKHELYNQWSEIESLFNKARFFKDENADRDIFLENIHQAIKASDKDYVRVIKSLGLEESRPGTRWLQNIVDTVTDEVLRIIPSFL